MSDIPREPSKTLPANLKSLQNQLEALYAQRFKNPHRPEERSKDSQTAVFIRGK
jgi:hypothetical protein